MPIHTGERGGEKGDKNEGVDAQGPDERTGVEETWMGGSEETKEDNLGGEESNNKGEWTHREAEAEER